MSTLEEKAVPAGHGASYDPSVSPDREDPYARYDLLRREEPVSYSPRFGTWLISRYDDVRQMLTDNRRFSTEGTYAKLSAGFEPEARALLDRSHTLNALNMLASDNEHARLRKPFHKFFTAAQVLRWEPMVRRQAAALIDGFPDSGSVDLMAALAYPLPLQGMFELLGVPYEDRTMVRPGVEAVLACMLQLVEPEHQTEMAHRVLAYEQYLTELIDRHRAEPRDNLMDLGVRALDAGGLSLPELVAILSENLVLAGYETTAKSIGNALYFLLTHREHWQDLIADPGLIPKAVDELLRLDAVVLGFFRFTTEPVDLHGVTIPAGDSVHLLYASANRDERHFPRPSEYDPHRSNLNDQVTFGYGSHYCLGQFLARLQLRVVLELLTTRLPGLRLVPGQEIRYDANLSIRGLERLMAESG